MNNKGLLKLVSTMHILTTKEAKQNKNPAQSKVGGHQGKLQIVAYGTHMTSLVNIDPTNSSGQTCAH